MLRGRLGLALLGDVVLLRLELGVEAGRFCAACGSALSARPAARKAMALSTRSSDSFMRSAASTLR